MHKTIKITILLIFVCIFILLLLAFNNLGTYLLVKSDIVRADAIVILMGSIVDRTLEAADLFCEGYAPLILFTRSFTEASSELLSRGVQVPDQADLTYNLLVDLELPETVVVIIPGEAYSTYEEAHIIRDYIKESDDINSIIVVTSSYHSKRTQLIFEHVMRGLEKELIISIKPSRYDSFQPEKWWKNRESAKRIVQEYQKLLYFLLWERYR